MPKNEEKCKQMREDMKERILKASSLYFAKNVEKACNPFFYVV